MKKKVLIMAGYYVPSVKGGGPIQSIKNLVENLSDRLDFYIVAADRDLGDTKPFQDIKADEWVQVGKANVIYTDYSELNWRKTAQIINSINYDVIYLNSFFSYKDSIVPMLLSKTKRIRRKPIVLAPRGQFSPGALDLKSTKKKLFMKIMKALSFYKNVTWHATADSEKKDIEAVFDNTKKILVAKNLTSNYEKLIYKKNVVKNKGELKVVFVSRIHPKKNLKKAIELLKTVKGEIEFNIYGPLEDKLYWSKCESEIKKLPSNIRVAYKGIVNHDEVLEIFKAHHVFLFPTLGENFGHVISEALIGGCPVIISDQTPWRGLENNNVGWDIELYDENKFVNCLQFFVDLGGQDYIEMSKGAFNYGIKKSNSSQDVEDTVDLFL
ncbi:MAG: glycosyltransferase [Bacillus sp. (in: firmicutes)]